MWNSPETTWQGGTGLEAGWVVRRYFVQEGRILPVHGSHTVTYDPFSSYYGTDAFRQGRSLYLDLAELAVEDEKAIEEFTSRWGLLGLFQHELVQVRHVSPTSALAGWYERAGSPTDHTLFPFAPLQPLKHALVMETAEGQSLLDTLDQAAIAQMVEAGLVTVDPHGRLSVSSGAQTEQARRSIAIHIRAQYHAWVERFPSGSVIAESPYGPLEEIPLEEYYGRFFPPQSAPASSADAPPHLAAFSSPELWDVLSEPLSLFRDAVARFRALYELCARQAPMPLKIPGQPPPADAASPAEAEQREIQERFARQLRRVHPVPRYSAETGTWSWGWTFPSLLSAAYAMMFLDFAVERRKLRFCANETCGKTFVTERGDRRYCSVTCQNTQKQREFRRAKKAAERPRKGESM